MTYSEKCFAFGQYVIEELLKMDSAQGEDTIEEIFNILEATIDE